MRRSKKHDARRPLLAIVGWLGISAVLLGYILNSFDIIQSSEPIYFSLNAAGALLLIVEAYLHHDLPPLVLNVIWALIAGIGLVRFLMGW